MSRVIPLVAFVVFAVTGCQIAFPLGGSNPDMTDAPPDLTATCSDGVQNGVETDVDCGGQCPRCADARRCAVNPDCASGVCAGGSCAAPACGDGVKNGVESDADCGGGGIDGGAGCGRCGVGRTCGGAADCASRVCRDGACVSPSCSDGVANGNETDVDCGGSCPQCADGKMCNAPIDCTSATCTAGRCGGGN